MGFWHKDTESTDWLAKVSFFEDFSTSELQRVLELSEEVEAEPGAELTDQGDPGQDCYVIVEGTASVYVGAEHIASLSDGSMVGEMALIDHRPRSATVVADTRMKLLKFDAGQFRTLLTEMPKASQRVMAVLNARLRKADSAM